MSVFSRGLGPRFAMIRCHISPTSRSTSTVVGPIPIPWRLNHARLLRSAPGRCRTTRLASSSASSSASPSSASASPARANPPNPNAAPPRRPSTLGARAYAHYLATKGQPTLLYEGPSHFWLKVGYIVPASVVVVGMAYQYWVVVGQPQPGLSSWVPVASGIILIASTFLAAQFFFAVQGIVRSVTALPSKTAVAVASSSSSSSVLTQAGAATGSPLRSSLRLRIGVERMLPLLPPYSIESSIDQVLLEPGLLIPTHDMTPAEAKALEEKKQAIRQAEREHDLDNILTAPFRHFRILTSEAFHRAALAVSRKGFASLRVGEKRLKIDMGSGWALDNGWALYRLAYVGRPR